MQWKGEYHPAWRRRFALFPVALSNHMVVWLEPYYQRFVDGPIEGHPRSVGRWELVSQIPAKNV